MFEKYVQFMDRHRLPIPDRDRLPAKYSLAIYFSTALITFGALMQIVAAILGAHLLTQSPADQSQTTQAELEQALIEHHRLFITDPSAT